MHAVARDFTLTSRQSRKPDPNGLIRMPLDGADKQENGFLLTREVSWRPTRRRRRRRLRRQVCRLRCRQRPPSARGAKGSRFSGTGGEYFGIWIVNILLSVLTLGVYSAWAKVRRMQFFYRNTQLAGAGFDYHGNPWAILKGRIVASGIMGAYYGLAFISPIAGGVAFLAVLSAMPWFISRALRFRLYNTSYRGLRFRFTGTTGEAYIAFLLMPIATLLTLGLLGPMWHQRLKNYVHSNASYRPDALLVQRNGRQLLWRLHAGAGTAHCVRRGRHGARRAVPHRCREIWWIDACHRLHDRGSRVDHPVHARVADAVGVHHIAHSESGVEPYSARPASIRLVDQGGAAGVITATNLLGIVFTLGFYKPFAVVRLTDISERVHRRRVGQPERFPGGRETDGGCGRRRSDRDVRSRSRGLMER